MRVGVTSKMWIRNEIPKSLRKKKWAVLSWHGLDLSGDSELWKVR